MSADGEGEGAGPVMVMGTGSICRFLGGVLAAAGVPVIFVGRWRLMHGLHTPERCPAKHCESNG